MTSREFARVPLQESNPNGDSDRRGSQSLSSSEKNVNVETRGASATSQVPMFYRPKSSPAASSSLGSSSQASRSPPRSPKRDLASPAKDDSQRALLESFSHLPLGSNSSTGTPPDLLSGDRTAIPGRLSVNESLLFGNGAGLSIAEGIGRPPGRNSLLMDNALFPENLQFSENDPRCCGVPGRRDWWDYVESYLAVVEEPMFYFVMGGVIVLNVFVLAGETDHADWPVWWYLDNVFLIIFIIEISLRLAYWGVVPFLFGTEMKETWLQAIIVIFGVYDLWIPALFPIEGNWYRHFTLTRFLRLIRLGGIIGMSRRVMKFVNVLLELVSTFLLTLGMLFVILFCTALICTRLFGHGEGLPKPTFETSHLHEAVQNNFKDVATSFFTLFEMMTLDNWRQTAAPIITLRPGYAVFFIIFICFFAWTMTSVLTAVASEGLIMATMKTGEGEAQEQEEMRQAFVGFLQDTFHRADLDGNGVLDRQEFTDLVESSTMLDYMQSLGITSITKDFLLKCWDMLDVDQSNSLDINEFVDGLSALHDELSTKHIVHVDNILRRAGSLCEHRLDDLQRKVDNMESKHTVVLSSLKMQDEIHEQQQVKLWLWQQWALERDPDCLPEEVLAYIKTPECIKRRESGFRPEPSSSSTMDT